MIARLIQRIRETGAPVCVGLDPMLSYIPNQILERAFDEKGENLEGAAEAVWQFNRGIIDATYDLIPAVKPQIAMYEQFGIPGLSVYEKTVRYCQEKALVVIGDAKRGDIGSTSEAYAAAHIGAVQIGVHTCEAFGTDMVTVNPYLGSDGIRPFLAACNQFDKGIFVLVKTSNPSGSEFQDRLIDGTPLYAHVADQVVRWGEESMDGDWSNVGAVVGATYPEMLSQLRVRMPHSFFLVPGYGAQGGTAEDLRAAFDSEGIGAVVNSSRGIIAAWKKDRYAAFGAMGFAEAARQAVTDMIADIRRVL